MMQSDNTTRLMQNEVVTLTVDLFGGALSSFQLKKNPVNPLSFSFSPHDMPVNNRAGAPYRGHFLCLGHWGEPSPGEIIAGLPNHGSFANMMWNNEMDKDDLCLRMFAKSMMEGLSVDRVITLAQAAGTFRVKETVQNTGYLGRLYNMVQHPTLAAPFLDENTRIYCNADTGFNNLFSKQPQLFSAEWPRGLCEDNRQIDLSNPAEPYDSIFSFIVRPSDQYGWVLAWSPHSRLAFGYLWLRSHYPWLNFWQQWSQGRIQYRGIEFGTTGLHKPFRDILSEGNHQIFGAPAYQYIDAGERISREYQGFIAHFPKVNGSPDAVDLTVRDEMIILSVDGAENKIYTE